jgi:hypothetical protein
LTINDNSMDIKIVDTYIRPNYLNIH